VVSARRCVAGSLCAASGMVARAYLTGMAPRYPPALRRALDPRYARVSAAGRNTENTAPPPGASSIAIQPS
jgi:hypothetical protein